MKASIALNSTKRMQSLSAPRPVALFFFVFGSYLVTSTAAKYLHELGHATVAYFLGVPLSSMTIVVNPFGSGYFRPTKFGFPTSNLENVLFAIAGAVVPILVLSLVSFLTINHGKMTKWLVGMLFGYSLLSNAVNLVSGAFTRASDGGYLVSLGLPVGWLLALCLLLGALGAFVLIKANFSVIVLSVERGLQKIVVFCGFLVSPLMGLALVDVLGDSFRRRLFFSSSPS